MRCIDDARIGRNVQALANGLNAAAGNQDIGIGKQAISEVHRQDRGTRKSTAC